MEIAQFGTEMSREQEMISTKKRLETFQFRRPTGSVSAPLSPTSSIGRPHSRQTSVSSVSFSASNSTNSILSTSDQYPLSSSESRPSSLVVRSRPTSHHRRRSSVSTRVESAEMMGISLPDLPASCSEENINFGDKDSIRRRALQALEGRNDLGSCNNMVEIPDFNSQGMPQKPFDREVKLSASIPAFGISSISGKRDSFGKFLSSASSLKDQLHTLMEEEEEEEENSGETRLSPEIASRSSSVHGEKVTARDHDHVTPQSASSTICGTPDSSMAPYSGVLGRHRPANLTLRPLSLISNVSSPSLPTPSLTPNLRPGLRSLSLTPQSDPHTANTSESFDKWSMKHNAAPHSNSSSLSSTTSVHFQSSSSCYSAHGTSPESKRQSSISYIRSAAAQTQSSAFGFASLPTPGATPTSERRQSSSSVGSFGSFSGQDRRNASEDMFLQQSHASLLARIAELERALQSRSHSRPGSMTSDSSSGSSEAPPDEMLQFVAALKAERDELHKDIDGWRQRVKDLERAKAILGHEKTVLECRLEAEKHENWLKGQTLDLLEMEKATLRRERDMKQGEVSSISGRLESAQAQLCQAIVECNSLKEDAQVAKRQLAEAQQMLEARKETELELRRARDTLAAEQMDKKYLVSQLDAAGILETPRVTDKTTLETASRVAGNNQPRNNVLSFRSVDSSCTTVDVDEENRQALSAPFTLKAVDEELGTRSAGTEDAEDELARYEDEDELDVNFSSPTRSTSSCDSEDGSPRSYSHLRLIANSTPVPLTRDSSSRSLSSTPSPTSSPCPTPIPSFAPGTDSSTHVNRSSLSKTWTFPRCGQSNSPRPSPEEVDRFFGCLEDIDNSPPIDSCPPMDNRSTFSQRLKFRDIEDDDLPPFLLPAQKVADGINSGMLDVVLEENEDDMRCGILARKDDASFPVSVSEDSISRTSTPLFDGHMQTKSVPFIFPQMKLRQSESKAIGGSPASLNSAEHSKPTVSAGSKADCSNVAPAPRVTIPRTFPPSRIPPPSPPVFIQAKGTVSRATPSPPKRKPVPSPACSGTAISPSRIAPARISLGSPQSRKKPAQSNHGSTFIPQLKTTSRPAHSSLLLQ